MDFEKKFPLTQIPNSVIIAQWTRGFREVELYYKDEKIASVKGGASLKKGITVKDTPLGEIQLKITDRPITLDLIVDGYHSPINVSHPKKQLKNVSTLFWIISALAILGSLAQGFQFSFNLILALIISLINLCLIAIYIVSAVFVKKGKVWAFYLGFVTYMVISLFSLLDLLSFNVFSLIGFSLRAYFIYALISNVKHAIGTSKHEKFDAPTSDEVIDGSF